MIVSDVMTCDVVSATPDDRLEDVVRLMVDRKLSGLPVVAPDGRVVGMLTEGDLMRRAEIGTEGKPPGWFEMFFMPGTAAYDYTQSHGRTVGMLMSSKVISIAPNGSVAEAARLMRERRVKRLPVIESGRLVGILARADLLKVLAAKFQPRAPMSDAEIRARISAELEKQDWIPKANVQVSVEAGVVELSGMVTDMRERDALCALAEAAGAKAVHNKIVYIEPISATVIE